MRNSSSPSDAALHQELMRRVARDQEVREQFAAERRAMGTLRDATARSMMAVDSANIGWLKPLLARARLPTRAQIGRAGTQSSIRSPIRLAWMLVAPRVAR